MDVQSSLNEIKSEFHVNTLDGFELENKFLTPDRLNIIPLPSPNQHDLDQLSYKYPGWEHWEIRNLWYFKMVHTKPEHDYNKCYCSHCQTDKHYHVNGKRWGRSKPKVTIPFRLFVNLSMMNFEALCEECDSKRIVINRVKKQLYVGIPKMFRDAYFENWIAENDYQKRFQTAAAMFVDQYPANLGLFLGGATGTGKTRMACTVINEIIRKCSITVCLADFHGLARKGRLKESDYKEYQKYDLLCIDDMTKDSIGMEFGQYIYPIINERYSNQKPTLITSNMSLQSYIESTNSHLQRLGDRFKDFICRESFNQKSMRGK